MICMRSWPSSLLGKTSGVTGPSRLWLVPRSRSLFITDNSQSIETDATRPSKRASPLKWLPDGLVQSSRKLGGHTTTAQVHPGLMTKFLAETFLTSPNTSLVLGRATSLSLTDDRAKSVAVEPLRGGEKMDLPADVVVLAAGPWTGKLAVDLLGKQIGGRLGVTGHRAHSIVLKTKDELSAHCLFTNMAMADGSQGEPELYARPDGTTYV